MKIGITIFATVVMDMIVRKKYINKTVNLSLQQLLLVFFGLFDALAFFFILIIYFTFKLILETI